MFEKYPEIFAVVSEKKDGSMKIFSDKSRDLLTMENRKKFFVKKDIRFENVSSALLCHGNKIEKITSKNKGKIFEGVDGLLTREKEVFLSVTIADCLPVFFYEPSKNIIAIVHAGWRGLQKGIIEEMINEIVSEGGLSENIIAGIGPAIGVCHYEVGEDVAQEFSRYGSEIRKEKNGNIFLDLKRIAQLQLIENGILVDNIEINKECTFCEKGRYFSFRRDSGGDVLKMEAMIAIIGLKR